MSRISVKLKSVRSSVGIKFSMPKLFVPVDCHIPTTAKDSVARQLYQAGIISKADFEKMLGVVYDGDFDVDMEVFDDEAFSSRTDFDQSSFASYEDFEDIDPREHGAEVQPDNNETGVQQSPESIPESLEPEGAAK